MNYMAHVLQMIVIHDAYMKPHVDNIVHNFFDNQAIVKFKIIVFCMLGLCYKQLRKKKK